VSSEAGTHIASGGNGMAVGILTQKLDPAAAAARVEQIDRFAYKLVYARNVGHPFAVDLQAGRLPLATVQLFFCNWYTFALEVNTALGTLYHRFVPLFKRYPELEDLITEKIADEFGQPGKGGHIRTLEKTAANLGISKDELVYHELCPAARALTDYIVRLTTEGTLAEYASMGISEGQSSHWSRAFSQGIRKHYLQTKRDGGEPYFSTHAEADRQDHQGGMGHGGQAKFMLRTLYELGEAEFRPGWSPEYVVYMGKELIGRVLDEVHSGVTVRGELARLGLDG
jgi:pyrroloquinoline quinone (PQQ) biosynthesis protein C